MANIALQKTDIPFWFGGNGSVSVHAEIADPTKPIPPSDDDLLKVNFNLGASQPFSLGAIDSLQFGISASADASLVPLWKSSSATRLKMLDDYGLSRYFDAGANHDNRMLMLLKIGAKADANLSAKFKYLSLSSSVLLEAGVDGSYALLRSYPADTVATDLIKDFFKNLRLPPNVDAPLGPNEVIHFEYGGYVHFKGSLGFGYEMSGSPSFEINQLQLSEKYGFSLMASIGLEARLAGEFSIDLKEGSSPGWVQVVLSKRRSKFSAIAADVSASATFQTQGLPDSADEFLSAVIGLNSKNWLSLFQQVKELSDFEKLQAYLDKLGKSFISEYTGKAFASLADKTQLDEVLDLIGKVLDQYRKVGDHAVTLFDKYFDVVKNQVDDKLGQALKVIQNATSWDQLKGHVDGTVWEVVQQLTDGDPLAWLLGKIQIGGVTVDSLAELKKRADNVLALIEDAAHNEIRKLISLAKSKFPLDKFIQDLGDIDWMKLQSLADARLVGFFERLLGVSIEKLSTSELGNAVSRFHEVLNNIDKFKNTLFAKMKEALDQSFSFQLHAEYSKATEKDALLDFELNLTTATGKALMKAAGHGDFGEVLAAYETGDVKLKSGILTHKVTRQSKLAINITGWHIGSHYQALDRIITESEQRILPDGNGQLSIVTKLDMQKERERKRNGERVYTNLLLRFLGESKGAIEFDKANQVYLIDAITGMSANYEMVFNDPNTTPHELAQYLSFADEFGLAASDEAAVAELEPLLPTDAQGNFGETSVTYKVRFTEAGLKSLFTKPFDAVDEIILRRTMRLIVLANYLNRDALVAKRAWCYWTPGAQLEWAKGQSSFTNNFQLVFNIAPSPFKNLAAPKQVTLKQSELFLLSKLFYIEQDMVEGMKNLAKLIQSEAKLSPLAFEKKMGDFGSALKAYDNIDEGENTVFAILDKLIQRNAANQVVRNSSLELKSKIGTQSVTKMLVA